MARVRKSETDLSRTCCRCHRPFDRTVSFYKTNSTVYTNNGFMPICKDCMYELFHSWIELYDGNHKMALKRLCMSFDIYYNDKLFFACDSLDIEVIIGNYMKKFNMVQYKNKTFEDSLAEGFDFYDLAEVEITEEVVNEELNYDDGKIRPRDIKKWGDGFNAKDYKILNEHYNYLVKANPNYDSNQEIFINELCYTKLLKDKAASSGNIDDYRKMSESYRKSFQQAGLKTVEDSMSSDEFSCAVNLKTIEQYTPAEYYKDKKLYKDFDGLYDYFKRFILRPLRNLQHGLTDRDKEYYVKDGDAYG